MSLIDLVNDIKTRAEKLEKLAKQGSMGLWSKNELHRQLRLINSYKVNRNPTDFNEDIFEISPKEELAWDEYKENHDDIF